MERSSLRCVPSYATMCVLLGQERKSHESYILQWVHSEDKREKAMCGHIISSTRALNNQLTQVSLYRELVSEGPLSTHSLISQC